MTVTPPPITPETSLATVAATYPGAAKVFHRLQLDFCCGGQRDFASACAEKGLATASVISAIEEEAPADQGFERWDEGEIPALIDHILAAYHEPHREDLPRLIAMAEKVERVHAEKDSCPRGLASHLHAMAESLELHMRKEEMILFPALREGAGHRAQAPIHAMEEEHHDHARNLERLGELASGFEPPPEACATWKALYLGLSEFDRQIREHIHLENNVLFPRALSS